MANLKDLIVNGSARVLGTLYASDIRNSSRLTEFIVGTQSSATGSWVGVTKDNSLYDGKNINYFLPVAGSGNASLNLTLSNGTTTGAKPVYLSGTSYVTTHYAANSCINMTYNATKGAWFVNADRDNNNDTYNRVKHDNAIKAASACTNGKIICGDKDGYKDIAAGVTFDIAYPILYCGTAIAANATGTNNYDAINSVNLQTTKASWTGTQYSMVFLVGTLYGTTFTIDSTVFTTTIPTAVDNKVYLPIGVLYSTYQIYFNPIPTLYACTNGRFQQYTSGGDNTFVVTYGTTTYAEIFDAYYAGKQLVCIWEDSTTSEKRVTTDIYIAPNTPGIGFYFNFVGGWTSYVAWITSSNTWNYGGGTLESAGAKVTSISSSSTDVQYPSAKCVYDYCQTLKAWCTTKPTTTSSATANNPSVVVENYLNGTSGYICFSDKLCIQWGEHGNAKTAVPLLVTMANTNYALLSTRTASGSGVNYTKATTTITPGQAWAATWVVIGYHA